MEIKRIIDHLTRETALYKEFIAILHKETENLINRDYKGLYETVGQKEHLLGRIQGASGMRATLFRDAAAALRMDKGAEVNLSAIIEKARGADRDALKASQEIVISLIESIKEINKLNSLVVAESLDNITKTLGFLGNFLSTGVYKPSGAFGGFDIKGSRLSEGA